MNMSFDIQVRLPWAVAIDKTIEALKAEGFGVLTRIDVHEAFKEKLDIDFRPYSILGACSPPLAHRALTAVPEIGLLLPCNVTVEKVSDEVSLIRIIDPAKMMSFGNLGENPEVAAVGREAAEHLRRVAVALGLA